MRAIASRAWALAGLAIGLAVFGYGQEGFTFYPFAGARKAPGFVKMVESPCGELALARVRTMPPADRGPLRSEVVVEIDARMKVLRRWRMPVDYWPMGVKGTELLARDGDDKAIWLRTDGRFRRASSKGIVTRPYRKCDLRSVFGASQYAVCVELQDRTTKAKRTIAYEAPCT